MKTGVRTLTTINQSSLSDIAFLLLVFFIATTIFPTEKGLALLLPQKGPGKPHPKKNALQIDISEGGELSVNETAIALTDLEPLIRERTSANPKTFVLIWTHPDAPYQRMVDVLDEVKSAEANRVALKMRETGSG